MHPRNPRDSAVKPHLDLIRVCLGPQMRIGAQLGEHGCFLFFYPTLFIFECLALFARRVGDAFWCLLCLDSLLLATAQVLGYLLCVFAACGRVELGEEGACPGLQCCQVVGHVFA